ncbi:LysR family transcriptional regulator [Sphingobium sp. SYK-6]|uniref:LysR family transcriptional regulator n=1 Tax=Sphingobium sp. (strain NBRC 103272 / SYK-6) TaxID=627192 RepID=UPI0002276E17|nr:LysR family transcriptional regulator [Sphingobium sp. SYK-6]BAK65651.1 LysR family transcriptional regulator [Sphingobium sp. SYK-6]
MLDRYLLRYFLAVVDQGNFSRAAALCHVSQPTLSVGIAKLENELGAALFLRSSQRVELTAAGARFLVHARRIESEYNLAERALADVQPARRLRIGWLSSVPSDRLAAALGAGRGERPGSQIEIVEGNERDIHAHLARGRIDLAVSIIRPGETRFREEAILEEGYRLAMPAGHKLAQQSVLTAEALASETMIVRRHCEALAATSRHFTERGVRPFFAMRSTNDERVLAMVAAGLGITVMPESHAHEGVVRPLLAGFDLRRTIGFLFGPHGDPPALADPPFLDALRTALRTARVGAREPL